MPRAPTANARKVALDALVRIDAEDAYANLLLPRLLDRADLSERDRGFATELVYGTTRMRRALDWLIDRFVLRPLDPPVRAALRLGTYQLAFLDTPRHAAVAATVDVAPNRARGLVNAILRRVADAPVAFPDDATRLSYPDWIVDRLEADLGADVARAALETMNQSPEVTRRDDGYVQDRASQWVAELVGAEPGERIADLCAAPGGKATALARDGARVTAVDLHLRRVLLLEGNARWLDLDRRIDPVVADATRPPFRAEAFDRVLVDAPCTGLGALRRRPDARWRIDEDAVERLAALQARLLHAAAALLRPGGTLVYAVCTLTAAETTGVDEALAVTHPDLVAQPPPPGPWEPVGRGARLLPQTAATDGMVVFRYRRR